VTGQPLTLSASFTTGADSTKMTALLDGVDITSQFSAADSNGLRSATVSEPAINYGKNQLQIRYDTTKVNSSFIFATAKDVATNAPGANAANSSLVPIKTRYLRPGADGTHATDWGVQVGGNIYYAPAPIEGTAPCTGTCNRGFQMLFLNRNDLSVVANNAYDVENDADLDGASSMEPWYSQHKAIRAALRVAAFWSCRALLTWATPVATLARRTVLIRNRAHSNFLRFLEA
jgi:hypothetical protein